MGITGFIIVAGPYTRCAAVHAAGSSERGAGAYTWDFKAVCSGSSRVGVAEVAETWTLRSVGNPVTGELVVKVMGQRVSRSSCSWRI